VVSGQRRGCRQRGGCGRVLPPTAPLLLLAQLSRQRAVVLEQEAVGTLA
jgi:hypothetical protein